MAASASEASASEASWSAPPDFDALNRYGWEWEPGSTADENYMDAAYLLARNSSCKDGHMGCVVVAGLEHGAGGATSACAAGEIVLRTINSPLFGAYRSDCHAEANAVAASAARGMPLCGKSVYVTRAPCLACYKLLASARVGRIVAPQPMDSANCAASAAALGIECCAVRDTEARAARREALGSSNEDMARVRALREERKRLRKEGTFGKKAIRSAAAAAQGQDCRDDLE